MIDRIPAELLRILRETPGLEQSYFVGGCVRDWLLETACKDFDLEVFGLSYDQLATVLGRWGRVDLVGRSFGVAKLTTAAGASYDFTIPRRESKVAPGHRGFEISHASDITPREAAARRDFTLNALMFDPRRNEVLDFFDGRADLENRVLRHTSAAFADDPLRVLRGLQLAGRFALTPAEETVALGRQMKPAYGELAIERVRDEWFKWAAQSVRPSAGLRFLAACEWIEHFPELHALIGTPQDPEWHPEGDVFAHTCHCCDALAELPEWRAADPESRVVYMLAVLLHDTGKARCTHPVEREGRSRLVSPGHEEASAALAERFLERIAAPNSVRKRVHPLVVNHMAHFQQVTDRSVRRLAKRLEPETIDALCLVITADAFGRPPKPRMVPAGVQAIQTHAAQLRVRERAPQPILLGRHLLSLGLSPGKTIGAIVAAAYEAQLEGAFADLPGAFAWLRQQTRVPLPEEVQRMLEKNRRS